MSATMLGGGFRVFFFVLVSRNEGIRSGRSRNRAAGGKEFDQIRRRGSLSRGDVALVVAIVLHNSWGNLETEVYLIIAQSGKRKTKQQNTERDTTGCFEVVVTKKPIGDRIIPLFGRFPLRTLWVSNAYSIR